MKHEPSHRKCVLRRHHKWERVQVTWSGWNIFQCRHCGKREI